MHVRYEFTAKDRFLIRLNTMLLLCVVLLIALGLWTFYQETKATRELLHALKNAPEELVKALLVQVPQLKTASSVLETLGQNDALGEGIAKLKNHVLKKN